MANAKTVVIEITFTTETELLEGLLSIYNRLHKAKPGLIDNMLLERQSLNCFGGTPSYKLKRTR